MQLQLSAAAAVLLAGLASATATPDANSNANALMGVQNLAARSFLLSPSGIFRREAVEYDDETSFSIGEKEDEKIDQKCFLKNCNTEKLLTDMTKECNLPNVTTTSVNYNTYVPTKEQGTCLCKSTTYIKNYNACISCYTDKDVAKQLKEAVVESCKSEYGVDAKTSSASPSQLLNILALGATTVISAAAYFVL
ncbi:hypothetical protein DFH27DRAFT_561908 [Peziza echinospora]|nr:hypothetical protein DFH27DRAFT_561908 [Peziza echinospora]